MNKEEKNYIEKYQPFYKNLNNYLKTFIIPEVIAFYLASSYEYNCLNKYPLKNHLNSIMEIFNVNCNAPELLPIVKETLCIKYNLIIVNTNPLILKKLKKCDVNTISETS